MKTNATRKDYLRRYPRICAHIISESLGYALPSVAAQILKDSKEGRENWCEWIFSCYDRDPRKAVRSAVANRHSHKGYMAEYSRARYLVRKAIDDGREPELASWF
jgi:hypothetical protein